MLRISEIFYSIQGEGIYQGIPMVFVRFAGCNLLTKGGEGGCVWCDTKYARDSSEGTEMSVEEVVKAVQKFALHYKDWVCITGGEPMFQLDALHELVKKLKRYGYRIEVETNGSIEKPFWWTLVDSWVFDIKCPSSGVCGISKESWFETRSCDQAKFVVGTREDQDFASRMIMRNMVKASTVLVSPVIPPEAWTQDTGLFGDKEIQRWLQEVVEFCKELRVRFSLQIHKVVWGNKRGV